MVRFYFAMGKNITKQQHPPASLATKELTKFRYSAEGKTLQLDQVIIEQPLQIRLKWQLGNDEPYQSQIFSITMRTPGDDKSLIIGLLQSEAVIQHFQVTYSSCGLCGTTSLKSLEMKTPPSLDENQHWLAFEVISAMPKIMRAAQSQFVQTGGSHAAALFNKQGVLVDIKEDIGRHNALDKLLGASLMHRHISQSQYSILVSGRISFEIVQKTVMAGVAVLIAVGAPSELAILAAKRFNLTLIGFTKNTGFNVYHGDWRLMPLVEKG